MQENIIVQHCNTHNWNALEREVETSCIEELCAVCYG